VEGLDTLRTVLRHEPQRLVGSGETFPMKVDGRVVETRVRLDPGPATTGDRSAATGPGRQIASEPASRSELGTDRTTARGPGWQPALGAQVGVTGGYGGVRFKPALPTEATTDTARTTVFDERTAKVTHGPDEELPVRVTLSVADRNGPIGGERAVAGRGQGWSYPVESVPDARRQPLEPGSGPRMSDVVPRTVTTREGAELPAQVAEMLRPDVSRVGAPGRQELAAFLSDHGLRSSFTAMTQDWVSSPPLISSDGRHTAQIQARIVPTVASRIGTLTGDLMTTNRRELVAEHTAKSEAGGELELTGGVRTSPRPIGAGASVSVTAAASAQREVRTTHVDIQRKAHLISGPIDLYDVGARLEVRVVSGPRSVDGMPHRISADTDAQLWMTPRQAADLGLGPSGPGPTPRSFRAYPPTHLTHNQGLGDARVSTLGSGPRELLTQVRSALGEVRGYGSLVPDPDAGPLPHGRTGRVAPATDVHRTLEAFLSGAHLASRMDSLLAGGIDQPFVRDGASGTTTVNVNVRARLSDLADAGPVPGSGVKVTSGHKLKLNHGVGTKRSVGIGFNAWTLFGAPLAVLSVVASVAGRYQWRQTTGAGPESSAQHVTKTGTDVHAVRGDITYDVTITEYHRSASWMRSLPVGRPGLHTPEVTTVARTGGPYGPRSLDPVRSRITLHVPADDMRGTPAGEPPAAPVVAAVADPHPLDGPTRTGTPLTPHSAVLAVGGADAIRDAAHAALVEAAGGDGVLSLPGGPGGKALSDGLSPERLRDDRALLDGGIVVQDLVHERRLADRTGAVRVDLTLENPRLVADGDRLPVSTERTQQAVSQGGWTVKSGQESTVEVGLRGGASVGDRSTVMSGAGGRGPTGLAQVQTDYTWSRTNGTADSAAGGAERSVAGGRRTYLVRADGVAHVVAESRQRNVLRDALSPAATGRAGREVRLPDAVHLRVDEQQARDWGLLPEPVGDTGPATDPAVALPDVGRHGLGSGTLENPRVLGEELGALADRLRTDGPDAVPRSTLGDSMAALQQTRAQLTGSAAHGLLGSVLGPGSSLLGSRPGLFGHTDSGLRVVAEPAGPPRLVEIVHDGAELKDKVTASRSADRYRTTTIGLRGSASATAGGREVAGVQQGSTTAVGIGPIATVGGSDAHKVTDADVVRTVRTTVSKGPSARVAVPVRLRLDLHQDGELRFTHTGETRDLIVRVPADDLSSVPATEAAGVPDTAGGPEHRPASDGSRDAALRWQRAGDPLPEEVRAASIGPDPGGLGRAVVSMLAEAGTDPRLHRPGGPVRTQLDALLSPEMWRSLVPRMLHGGAGLPALHSPYVGGPDVRVTVYARMSDLRTDGVSHTVDVAGAEQHDRTRETELSSSSQRGVGGALVPGGRDPVVGQGSTELTATGRDDTVRTDRPTVHDPVEDTKKGATRLVGGPTEYRVVVEVTHSGPWGSAQMLVGDVRQDSGLQLRMPEDEASSLLGALPEVVNRAGEQVRDAAAAWRAAEKQLEDATAARDELWWRADPGARAEVAATADPGAARHRADRSEDLLADLQFRIDALTSMLAADPLGAAHVRLGLDQALAEAAAVRRAVARDRALADVLDEIDATRAVRDRARAAWAAAKAALDRTLAPAAAHTGDSPAPSTTASPATAPSTAAPSTAALSAEDFDRIVNPGPPAPTVT
jgi:hypothetical protein